MFSPTFWPIPRSAQAVANSKSPVRECRSDPPERRWNREDLAYEPRRTTACRLPKASHETPKCWDHLLQGPSISPQHDAETGHHDPHTLRPGFERFSFSIDAQPGEKIIPRPTVLGELLVFSEAIVPNGRRAEQEAFVFRSHCLDHIAGGKNPRIIQKLLLGCIPLVISRFRRHRARRAPIISSYYNHPGWRDGMPTSREVGVHS